ncbi:MAG: cytochrome ubiquinol oxidase subunit I [Anaerolineaceae bacterium]|nr:cytochrome ubiquinol oxidase subunit I [Anaerolineaceae bacterium]
MNPTSLAQWQFGITTIYHFFFVPLTIGLSVLIAIMETLYVRTGQELYKRMTKFWGKFFLINFAMGVVTGIVQEFQFGMNWSEYSRFVGNIFGAPLAIEALLAFFLESTFLGLWIFGWERLSPKMHLAAIWLVAFGVNMSALWILVANSFMQQPVGYAVVDGQAVMTDFWALIGNSHVWVQFPHTVAAGLTTGAFFVMGISAYQLLRKRETALFNRSFQIANIFGIISVFLVILVGHSQGQHMVQVQPMKMAAAEALWESEDPASFSLFTIGDQKNLNDVFAVRIPRVLSLLSYNRLEGEVKGIRNLQMEYELQYGQGNYVPSVFTAYWSFRIMVGAGFLMFFLSAWTLYRIMRRWPIVTGRYFKYYPLAILLPYAANTTGWLLTEMGRQPWVVFGLMKTADGVSSTVSAGSVMVTLIGFTLVYGLLMGVDIYLLAKHAKAGPETLLPVADISTELFGE